MPSEALAWLDTLCGQTRRHALLHSQPTTPKQRKGKEKRKGKQARMRARCEPKKVEMGKQWSKSDSDSSQEAQANSLLLLAAAC